eukprot:9484507-Pyramimonas_sp.AAC.1
MELSCSPGLARVGLGDVQREAPRARVRAVCHRGNAPAQLRHRERQQALGDPELGDHGMVESSRWSQSIAHELVDRAQAAEELSPDAEVVDQVPDDSAKLRWTEMADLANLVQRNPQPPHPSRTRDEAAASPTDLPAHELVVRRRLRLLVEKEADAGELLTQCLVQLEGGLGAARDDVTVVDIGRDDGGCPAKRRRRSPILERDFREPQPP